MSYKFTAIVRSIFLLPIFIVFIPNSSAQNVGIGTSTPFAKLHIQEGSSGVEPNYSTLILERGSSNNYLRFFTPDNYESAILFHKPSRLIPDGIFYNSSLNPDGYLFRNNGAIPMVIRNNENVGIGINDPQQLLSIKSGINIDQAELNHGGIDNNEL